MQTGRQAGRQTDRQTDKQRERKEKKGRKKKKKEEKINQPPKIWRASCFALLYLLYSLSLSLPTT